MGGFRTGPTGWCAAAVAAAVVLGAAATAAPAHADTTVTVQGTAFPDPARTGLSLVGCADLYRRAAEPLNPTIGPGPGTAPAGTRSMGWDLSGGNAVGALFVVDSMLSTSTASMAVSASDRASGVAYAGYQEPADAGTTLLWLGRSELSTPGGAWQTVEAAGRAYTWTKYDMATHHAVAPGPGVPTTVADFAAAHGGDGPGVYTIGFGCDGTAFSMDQLRVGSPGAVTTYDVEALRTHVTIDQELPGPRDGAVTITGRLWTGTGDPVPNATLVLERRLPGSSRWKQVLVADADQGRVQATVDQDGPTLYRWRFVERPLAEASASVALLVSALAPPPPSASPTPTPTPSPSPAPTSPSPPSGSGPPTPGTPSPPAPAPSSPSVTVPELTPGTASPTETTTTETSPSETSPSGGGGSPTAGSPTAGRADSRGTR